jgi:tRNA/rRNA methyltransferase
VSPELEVVLVRPKEDGNVGAVARLCRNFGVRRLVLVGPRARLGAEARRRAMGGLELLKRRRVVATVDQALRESDLVVGSTDLVTGRSHSYLRQSVSPERLGELVLPAEGRVTLLFGPEDNGLDREALARCDLIVHVPARREFPTLNLSHACAVILYAMHRARSNVTPEDTTPEPEPAILDGRTKEIFLDRLATLLAATGYPAHKRKGMKLLFRRLLGRAVPTESEYRMLLGVLKSLDRRMRRPRHG